MDWLMPLLTDTDSIGHILLVYSVVIALGMALGRLKVFGISLGVTFVLFVALAVSYAGITVNGTVLKIRCPETKSEGDAHWMRLSKKGGRLSLSLPPICSC